MVSQTRYPVQVEKVGVCEFAMYCFDQYTNPICLSISLKDILALPKTKPEALQPRGLNALNRIRKSKKNAEILYELERSN